MLTFRVHFADGSKIDVQASTVQDARDEARRRRIGTILKVKRVRE